MFPMLSNTFFRIRPIFGDFGRIWPIVAQPWPELRLLRPKAGVWPIWAQTRPNYGELSRFGLDFGRTRPGIDTARAISAEVITFGQRSRRKSCYTKNP